MKRRVKKVAITRQFLEMLFMGEEQHYRIKNPLPNGTRIVQIGYDIATDTVIGIIEHESFPEVHEANVPSHYMLELETIT